MSAVSELPLVGPSSTVITDWFDGLEKILLSGELIIGLNIAYDMSVALAERPELFTLVFQAYDQDLITDVAIRQKLIDIALGEYRMHGKYSLAALAKRLLDKEIEKEDTWRLRYWELKGIPISEWPQDAVDYPRIDAEIPWEIYEVQERELRAVNRSQVLVDQFRQSRAAFALQLVRAWGLRTDEIGVAKLRTECEEKLDKLKGVLLDAGLLREVKKKGEMTISRCMRVAQKRMQDVCENPRLTKTGKELKRENLLPEDHTKYISVDAEACTDSGDERLEQYTEYSQVGSLLSGHVKAVEAGIHMPIHPYFEVLLETGRTSASNPNTQNVRNAEGARECYVPRKGWVYVACDFDKAELHTLAQVCINLFGRSHLAEVLNNNYDPHIGLGARLAHTTYDDLKARVKAGDKEAKQWRQRAKPGNFGFPGGMGPEGMQRYAKTGYKVLLSLDEATDLHTGWQEEYPVVAHDYLGWIGQLVSATGHATIEHFDSHRWRGRVSYCVAANSFFQGMASDAMKAALWAVIKKCYMPGTPLYGCRVVNEIHDEFLLEAPLAIYQEAAWELRDTMVDAFNTYTRDVPVRATPAAMDRWSKGAETIISDSGELGIWRYAA
jgi:hypothetical protein